MAVKKGTLGTYSIGNFHRAKLALIAKTDNRTMAGELRFLIDERIKMLLKSGDISEEQYRVALDPIDDTYSGTKSGQNRKRKKPPEENK